MERDEKMKVTIIHGQDHKGSSYNIGKMLSEKISNAEITEFFLPRELNHFCKGCYTCTKDETKCPYYEEKNVIMQAVEAADVLIFTTPTYCMHASAPMKAFIDLSFTYWMPHRPRKCMFSKKAVVISTAAGSGAKSATKDVATALQYWGVPYVKQYGIAVQAASWDQVSEKKKEKIENKINKLANGLQKSKVNVGLKTKFLFSLMRLMQSKGMGSDESERVYWEEQGWLEKARPWK